MTVSHASCKIPEHLIERFWGLTKQNRKIHIPFPTPRLASIAIRSLSVDSELSSLVRRSFTLVSSSPNHNGNGADLINPGSDRVNVGHREEEQAKSVLEVIYAATTNRMLRVAVNGFWESLGVVVQVMEELDEDVAMKSGSQSLQGVQGLEEVRWKDS
jgi:EKC/KEOPS complex subunit PCC1/LAGE3